MADNNNSQTVQEARISDKEKALLRATFSGQDELLVLTRNALFGYKLLDHEKKLLKDLYRTEGLVALMRKILLPELDRDNPIGQSIDLFLTVDVVGKDEYQQKQAIEARKIMVELLESGLARLADVETTGPELHFKFTPTGLIARNTYITHVEMQLRVIMILAKSNEEPEAIMKRLAKNSAK